MSSRYSISCSPTNVDLGCRNATSWISHYRFPKVSSSNSLHAALSRQVLSQCTTVWLVKSSWLADEQILYSLSSSITWISPKENPNSFSKYVFKSIVNHIHLYDCCHISSIFNILHKMFWHNFALSRNHNQRMRRTVARLTLITRRWCIRFYMNVVISSIFNSLHKGDKCLHLAEITIKEWEESCPTHPNNSKVMHKFLYECCHIFNFQYSSQNVLTKFCFEQKSQRMRGEPVHSP